MSWRSATDIEQTHAMTWEQLYASRIEADKLRIALSRAEERIHVLEEENEALRKMISHVTTGGR